MEEHNGNEKQGGLSWSTPLPSQIPPAKPAAQKTSNTQTKVAPKAAGNSQLATYIGMVVVGIVAGVIIAWAWSALSLSGGKASTSSVATSTAKENTVGTVAATEGSGSFSIASPQAAGTSVTVAKAVVSAPTWIVIYDNKDGKPGNALGATLFFPERQSGSVSLLRATIPGKTYLAVRQTDNGDRKFSLKDDKYLSEAGAVEWVTFQVK